MSPSYLYIWLAAELLGLSKEYKGEEADGFSLCQRMREHLQFAHVQDGLLSASARLSDTFNNPTRRDLRHERDADDGAPPGLHAGSADNLVDRPISAFHQDVGVYRFNQEQRIGFLELDDVVHARQRAQNFHPVLVRHHGPARPLLQEPDRGIAVDAHDQHVPQRPCCLEIPDVPDVKQVEAAVRKHHPGALFPLSSQEGKKFLYGNDVRTHNQPDRSFGLNSL